MAKVKRYIVTTRYNGQYRWRPIDGVKSDRAAIDKGQDIANELADPAVSDDHELWTKGALTIKDPEGNVIWHTLTTS